MEQATATVIGFDEGFTNTGRFPFVLARLSCGHVARCELRPTRARCVPCGTDADLPMNGSITLCANCGASNFSLLSSPNAHNAADRLTKMGDVVSCSTCDVENQQLAWLDALDLKMVHHSRLRHGSYHFYRLDPSSPSSFFLIGSVMVSPKIEAKLREKRLSPLSPTEQA